MARKPLGYFTLPLDFWVKGEKTSTFKSRSQASRYSKTFDEGPTVIKKGYAGLFSVFRRMK